MARRKSKAPVVKRTNGRHDDKVAIRENTVRCRGGNQAIIVTVVVAITVFCAAVSWSSVKSNHQEAEDETQIDYGNHNVEWEDGHASWDEFGHDNDPNVCGIPVLTVEEWERGKHWEGNRPVLVKNITDGWAALKHWKLQEMLRRYPDAEATMGDAKLIGETGPDQLGRILTPTTVKEFITKHMYNPGKYFFDRRISIPRGMLEDCQPFPMPTRAFFLEKNPTHHHRWRDHFTISIGADLQGLTFHGHGAAWNIVIFGAKRWILWETTTLNATMQLQMRGDVPAHEWIRTLHKHQFRVDEIKAHGHDCIQHAGDMMFIPDGCKHMVVNIGNTVAVVSEVDLDKERAKEPTDDSVFDINAAYNPGVPLLNYLISHSYKKDIGRPVLHAEASSIRAKHLRHHLCPQPASISPDGETSEAKPLVTHGEFAKALSNAVKTIHDLVAEGKFEDRSSANNLMEDARQVASEARVTLVECFGEASDVVNEFQRYLKPVHFGIGAR